MGQKRILRIAGWESPFFELAAQKMREPFAWGVNDCLLMAMDFVRAVTGTDLAAEFRGRYHSKIGAYRIINEYLRERGIEQPNLETFLSLQAKEHNIPDIGLKSAQRGDLCLYLGNRSNHLHSLGVCLGADCLFAGGRLIPLTQCLRAWRI